MPCPNCHSFKFSLKMLGREGTVCSKCGCLYIIFFSLNRFFAAVTIIAVLYFLLKYVIGVEFRNVDTGFIILISAFISVKSLADPTNAAGSAQN